MWSYIIYEKISLSYLRRRVLQLFYRLFRFQQNVLDFLFHVLVLFLFFLLPLDVGEIIRKLGKIYWLRLCFAFEGIQRYHLFYSQRRFGLFFRLFHWMTHLFALRNRYFGETCMILLGSELWTHLFGPLYEPFEHQIACRFMMPVARLSGIETILYG